MNPPRVLLVVLLAGLAVAASARPAAAVTVTVDRARIATELGGRFAFRSTISNRATTAARGLIAHLNVLSLRPGVYVDPEDWSSDRTQYVGTIPPGGSRTLTWRLQAVTAGSLGVYVAVLTEQSSARAPATAPAIRVAITERRTLNAGGIVPVALGIPFLLGMLALAVGLRRAR